MEIKKIKKEKQEFKKREKIEAKKIKQEAKRFKREELRKNKILEKENISIENVLLLLVDSNGNYNCTAKEIL